MKETSKYAIDKPYKQQLFLSYSSNEERKEFLDLLKENGFQFLESLYEHESNNPLVVNLRRKDVYMVSTSSIACALSCGAKVLSIEKFKEEVM